jgi:hypothetical protein
MAQIQTQYNNPDIEAYRLGLLSDTQGLIRNQQLGRQVQGLRGQVNPATGVSYTDAEIAQLLSTPGSGTEGEAGYVAPTNYDPAYISSISPDAVFQPPAFQVAGLNVNQADAIDLASKGVGSYKPYLQAGTATLGQGIATVGAGVDAAQSGTNFALSGLQNASNMGQSVSDTTAFNARSLNAPLGQSITGSTQGALNAAATGQLGATQAAQFGLGAAKSGIAQLAGASAAFDPTGIDAYNNPYQDAVVAATLADLERVAARRQQAAEDEVARQAVSAGAFGSSGYERALDRSINPIQEELDRNTASAIAQLRSQGYESSAQRAMSAFEAARNRQLQTAQTTGQLGQVGAGISADAALQGAKLNLDANQMAAANAQAIATTGLNIEQLAAQTGMNAASLAGDMANRAGVLSQGLGSLMTTAGQAQGQLGIQQAGMGELEQSLRRNDISDLLTTGGIQQTNEQAVLDAQRMTDQQSYQLPFQETGFLGDIYAGVPTSASTVTSGSTSSASPFMQAATLGIGGLSAAAGAAKSGLF